ncbi:MAG: DNA primase [Thermodesulfovibrio sp.]|nr:DNA primase [Thermodesulfovibrio sp.]MDW7998508.1 DNA primase [Thermodesulfovibrio sp.]
MDYQKILEEIKQRLDIVELISEYIDLKKTGQNYRSLCPFHSEKTPSFFVNPSKQIFHCFGCGKGGDIVTFLMEYEKVSFIEAISILAKKAGLQFEPVKKNLSPISKEKLYEIYENATYYYMEQLKSSEKAKQYLEKRGINQETIEVFKIGYAPSERNFLYKFLKEKNFDDILINSSGLVSNSNDFFRNRIIIPIHDLTGRVIGFGGRLIDSGSDLPKYINSPDTPIFKKGENLFGLWHSKQYIREKGYVIVVEGYIDVILCHQYGFKNAVAPLGTALTQEQLEKTKRILNNLKKFTNKILLIFDGDEAGLYAAQKSLLPIFYGGFIAKIVLLPEKEDPASFLQKYGDKAFKNYISKALSPVDLIIRTYQGKKLNEGIRIFLHTLSYLKDLIYRDELLKELSEKTGINERTLRDELKQIARNKTFKKEENNIKNYIVAKEEEILLRIVLSYPEKINYILEKINIEDFEMTTIRNIFSKIEELKKQGQFSLNRLLNTISEEEKAFISKLIITSEIDEDLIIQNMNDCIKRLTLKSIDKKIKKIAKSGDGRTLQELIRIKKDIIKNYYG